MTGARYGVYCTSAAITIAGRCKDQGEFTRPSIFRLWNSGPLPLKLSLVAHLDTQIQVHHNTYAGKRAGDTV